MSRRKKKATADSAPPLLMKTGVIANIEYFANPEVASGVNIQQGIYHNSKKQPFLVCLQEGVDQMGYYFTRVMSDTLFLDVFFRRARVTLSVSGTITAHLVDGSARECSIIRGMRVELPS